MVSDGFVNENINNYRYAFSFRNKYWDGIDDLQLSHSRADEKGLIIDNIRFFPAARPLQLESGGDKRN